MSTIKSSAENLTLNADGANNDIKFQSNGTEVASIDQAGNVIAAGGVYVSGELQVTQVANNEAIDVSTNGTTTNAIRVIASALTTGKAAQIYSNSASTGTRNLVEIWNDHADSTGATALYVDNDSTGLAADFQGTGGIRSAGGIKFGTDTAAANALDDYEEGTWTPVFSGSSTAGSYSYAVQVGYYTKIGRLVTVTCSLFNINDDSGAGAGNIKILGLPFTVSSGPHRAMIGALELDQFAFAGSLSATAMAGETFVELRDSITGAGDDVLQVADRNNDTSDMCFQVTYTV